MRQPLEELLDRSTNELAAEFDPQRPSYSARAPGSLDVMGGIAETTGTAACRATLRAGAAVLVQPRPFDRQVQIFSFDELDAHRPFTLRLPLDTISDNDSATLRSALERPGRAWAASVIGVMHVLHEARYVDWREPRWAGFNIAMMNRVPAGRGGEEGAAMRVAAVLAFAEVVGQTFEPTIVAYLAARAAEIEVTAAPQRSPTIAAAFADRRLVVCWSDTIKLLPLPSKVRLIALDSGAAQPAAMAIVHRGDRAAAIAYELILDKMRQLGRAAGREMISDPMRGQLGKLDAEDYKRFFRPYLPEWLEGRAAPTSVNSISPTERYPVRFAADHHVLEPRRVREFVHSLEEASTAEPGTREAGRWLDRAGHLMYASNHSYENDAMTSSTETSLLVSLARAREKAGIYGARTVGNGAAEGVVLILADESESVDAAIAEVQGEYEAQTNHRAILLELNR